MRVARFLPWLVALLIALSAVLPGATVAAAPPPKVVVIVGPVGEATARYLARGEAAARAAEKYTSNVVRVFTPNATWPAVREAIQGASMVVYLGHGNGFPSKYRKSLYPPTQNGFGLNPVAGAGNDAHQYFGEGRIAAEVKLAKNAVVLLGHLCYASGNTEPGLPEGTEDEARQRVDNYAAGFIKSGASAVLADGELSPAWYVSSILKGKRTIEKIWQSSPSRNGNAFAFASERSPGFTAAMDPDRPGHGFYRSLVVRSGLLADDVAAGAVSRASVAVGDSSGPSLVGSGVTLAAPYIKGRILSGSDASLWIPFTVPGGAKMPELTVGVRWDPIDLFDETAENASSAPATEPAVTPAEPEPTASPAATPAPTPAASPDASPEPEPAESQPPEGNDLSGDPFGGTTTQAGEDLSGDPFGAVSSPAPSESAPTPPDEPPVSAPQPTTSDDPAEGRLSLVEPEQVGTLVEPARAAIGPTRIIVPLTLPSRPGRYRLVATLHDATGVAFDAESQALLPGLLVRVSGDVGARYLVTKTASVTAGASFELRTGVVNVGKTTWGSKRVELRRQVEEAVQATLVGHWVNLSTSDAVPADVRVLLPGGVEGGATVRVTLAGTAPTVPGTYLLVLDVIAPEVGSLVAHGIEPGLVRVTVEAAAD